MIITKTIESTRKIIHEWKLQNTSIGFIPTMGSLHKGHISLIQEARKHHDKIVVSLFVNPTQFGPTEDFTNYPRNIQQDKEYCEEEAVDLLFNPAVNEIYISPSYTYVDIQSLGDHLCGTKRPGHFRGVCTIVTKLFNIISPDGAYFGEKDAQQLAIIKKMVEDLHIPVTIHSCPTIREKDGLAMSSRNAYLTPSERLSALALPESLELAKESLLHGETNVETIRSLIQKQLCKEPQIKIDYIDIVDVQTLQPIEILQNNILVAAAVYIGKTRLIDNFQFQKEK